MTTSPPSEPGLSVSGSVRRWKQGLRIKTYCVGPGAVGLQGVKVAGASQGPATTVTKGEELLEGTEGRLLNRVLRCTLKGWEVEPDQRHTDLIVQELDLGKANEVITPGEKDPKGKAVEVEEELSPEYMT